MLSLGMRFLKSFQFYKSVSGKLMMAILAASVVLTGCGGGSSSTINEAAVLARITGGITANTGSMTITVINQATNQPIMNAYVVIDSTGTPQASNAQGVVIFTGLTAGAHDVHVFADGYTWQSALQVNLAALTVPLDTYPHVNNPTVASMTVPIANIGVNPYAQQLEANLNINGVFSTANGTATGTNDALGNPNYTFTFYLSGPNFTWIPLGQSVTGVLSIEQREFNSNTQIDRVIDAVNTGSLMLTASAVGTAVPILHPLISLHAIKPALNNLVTVTAVISPTMVQSPYVSVTADRPNHGVFSSFGYLSSKNNFTPIGQTVLTGFDLANYANIQVSAGSSDTYTYWMKMKLIPTGSTTSFNALTTSLPSIAVGQIGATIAWISPQGSYIFQGFSVLDNQGAAIWRVISPRSRTSVVLPIVPASIARKLVIQGASYPLGQRWVRNILAYTYNQALSSNIPVMNWEDLREFPFVPTVSWTR